MADPTKVRINTSLKLGGFLGFTAGFLFAYQRSSCASLVLYTFFDIQQYLQSDSGDGQKTNARRREISKSLANVCGKENHCMANHLSQLGYNKLPTEIHNGHSSSLVSRWISILSHNPDDTVLSSCIPNVR